MKRYEYLCRINADGHHDVLSFPDVPSVIKPKFRRKLLVGFSKRISLFTLFFFPILCFVNENAMKNIVVFYYVDHRVCCPPGRISLLKENLCFSSLLSFYWLLQDAWFLCSHFTLANLRAWKKLHFVSILTGFAEGRNRAFKGDQTSWAKSQNV